MKTFVAVLAAGILFICGWEFVVSPIKDWQKRKHDALSLFSYVDEQHQNSTAAANRELAIPESVEANLGVEGIRARMDAVDRAIEEIGKTSSERDKVLKALKQILESKPFLPLNAEEAKILKHINHEFAPEAKASLPSSDELTSVVRKSAPARDPNEFQNERQTLYARITKPTRVDTASGAIDLQPGNLVLVTARNAQFARVRLDAGEATIPLSVTDLTQQ